MLKRKIQRLRLVRGRKKLVKLAAKIKKKYRNVMLGWWYKTTLNRPFRKFLAIVKALQRDFRVKMHNRKRRIYFQKKHVFKDTLDTVISTIRFRDTIKKVTYIQKNYKFFRFLKLIRFAKAIKEILWEHFSDGIWPEILLIIREQSAVKIQKLIRGHIIRQKFLEEQRHLRAFRRRYKLNKSAKTIQRTFKGHRVRKRIADLTRAAVFCQKNSLAAYGRKAFLKMKKAAVTLQVKQA
jgi:hypothetical protein